MSSLHARGEMETRLPWRPTTAIATHRDAYCCHFHQMLHALNTTWSAAEQPATWTWVRIQRGSSMSGTWVHRPQVSEVHKKINDWETSFDPHNGFSAHLIAAANTSSQHLSAAEANWWQKPPQYSSLAKSYKRKLMKPFNQSQDTVLLCATQNREMETVMDFYYCSARNSWICQRLLSTKRNAK